MKYYYEYWKDTEAATMYSEPYMASSDKEAMDSALKQVGGSLECLYREDVNKLTAIFPDPDILEDLLTEDD